MIYHYTTISTLHLILNSGKIRFNNLKDVDDVLENELFIDKKLAPFIFVSCWTKDSRENIPLWKMYAGTNGVRIGLPEYPWKKINCKNWKTGTINILQNPNIEYYSPFEFHEIFGENHIILPPYFFPNSTDEINGYFQKDVIYLTENELKKKYQNIYSENSTKSETVQIRIDSKNFGLYKHEHWDFQREFRFVLFICPIEEKYSVFDKNFYEKISPSLMKYIHSESNSKLKDFYIDLDRDSIKNMEIILGPHCTDDEKRIVNELREKNKIIGTISESSVKIK